MHLLLDVLLTDTWEMALRKVALATQAARSDIQFTHQHMTQLGVSDWIGKRRRCRHLVRRTHRDEQGLDVLWLMLSAAPGQPWTFAGWIDRLTDAFNSMQLTQVEEGLLRDATDRYERWTQLAGGFPATQDDPFKAVTSKEWGRAEAAERDRVKDDRARAAIAWERRRERERSGSVIERVAAAANIRERLGSTLQQADAEALEAAQESAGEDFPGITVIAGEAKLTGAYKALVGSATPLVMTPNLKDIRQTLLNEYPHAGKAIDTMLGDLRPGEPMAFRPCLLVCEPGCGKSRLIRRLGELMGGKVRR
jgi:hypothetical protein